jgi:hypothetical protein
MKVAQGLLRNEGLGIARDRRGRPATWLAGDLRTALFVPGCLIQVADILDGLKNSAASRSLDATIEND